MTDLPVHIEAILYLKGQALSLEEIAQHAGCDLDTATEGMIELMGRYAHWDGALEVVETADRRYALQLKTAFQPLCDRLIPAEIGTGALRTLAAIALRGPLSQSALVDLRGGSAYQHVQELVDMGLIRKRRQSGNRSALVQVTDKFKQTYELNADLQALFVPSSPALEVDEPTPSDEAAPAPEVAEVAAAMA
jgi:segregation and condensation protein B